VLLPVANIKSQIKRIGTNEKSRLRNKAAKAEVKTRIKSAVYTAETGADDAASYLRLAVKRLDKAAARGIIHRNQASNRKSALMRHVARFGAPEASDAETAGVDEADAAAPEQGTSAPAGHSRRPRSSSPSRSSSATKAK